MKTKIMWLWILLTGMAAVSYAEYGAQGMPGSPADQLTWTVMTVDSAHNTVIAEESGVAKTFIVANASSLQDLKKGDKIQVTPDQNDPAKASVQKK